MRKFTKALKSAHVVLAYATAAILLSASLVLRSSPVLAETCEEKAIAAGKACKEKTDPGGLKVSMYIKTHGGDALSAINNICIEEARDVKAQCERAAKERSVSIYAMGERI